MKRQSAEATHASLELMVLSALRHQQGYGYQIQKRIQQASGERINIRVGTLYRVLHKLKEKGLVASWWEQGDGPDRRWYKLTAKGLKALDSRTSRWRTYVDCIVELLDPESPSATL